MPFTFFAHQVPVLPLKWAKPRWFDGTALCVGSTAPDLAYVLSGLPIEIPAHSLSAQVWWTLPVSYGITRVIRSQIALPLSAHLPGWLSTEVAALARSVPATWITLLSALIGGLTHIFIDGFTHPGGWAVERYASLRSVVIHAGDVGITAARLLQYTGHLLGTTLGFGLFSVMIRARKVSAWQSLRLPDGTETATLPTVMPRGAQDARFNRIVQIGCWLALPAAISNTLTGGGIETAFMRAACTIALAIWIGCRSEPLSVPQ